jgi:hypothetical protein
MAVVIEDRPTEAVRDEVIDQLIMNYSHGKLSYEAFERRLDKAMASQNNAEINALAEDLDLAVDKVFVENKKRDFAPSHSTDFTNDDVDESDYLVNIFGGSNRSGQWSTAREIYSISVFGGSNIDFSEANFCHPVTTMKVFCLFGGDDIFIPEDINVVSKVFCIFGGVDNTAPSITNRQAPTLVIEGFVIFGGIDIKIKRSVKEKFVAFADHLKNLFN